MHLHTGEILISFTDLHNMREIQSAVHTVTHHIKCNGYQIHITGTLAIAEQSTFHTVCSGQYAELRIADTASSVIVRMERYDYILAVFQIFTHIFYLACIYMRHGMLYSYRQIDDAFVICCRLPYIKNCIAYF